MDIGTINFGRIILQVFALFMALTFHEFAHAFVARKLGDRTAESQGRLTLNPKDHIDPFGTILLPLMLILMKAPVVFGWAKPVPINPLNFRNPRKGMMWSALGGPAINLLLAVILTIVFKLLLILGVFDLLLTLGLRITGVVEFFNIAIYLNVFLALFNLIPIPPLDGGRVLVGLLPREQAYAYSQIEPYGFLIVIGLVYFRILNYLLHYPAQIIFGLLKTIINL